MCWTVHYYQAGDAWCLKVFRRWKRQRGGVIALRKECFITSMLFQYQRFLSACGGVCTTGSVIIFGLWAERWIQLTSDPWPCFYFSLFLVPTQQNWFWGFHPFYIMFLQVHFIASWSSVPFTNLHTHFYANRLNTSRVKSFWECWNTHTSIKHQQPCNNYQCGK